MGLSFHARDREPEGAARPAPALDADRATHGLDQVSTYRETETGTAKLAICGVHDLRERLKQKMLLRRVDADPRIGDLEAELCGVCPGHPH